MNGRFIEIEEKVYENKGTVHELAKKSGSEWSAVKDGALLKHMMMKEAGENTDDPQRMPGRNAEASKLFGFPVVVFMCGRKWFAAQMIK